MLIIACACGRWTRRRQGWVPVGAVLLKGSPVRRLKPAQKKRLRCALRSKFRFARLGRAEPGGYCERGQKVQFRFVRGSCCDLLCSTRPLSAPLSLSLL